MTKALTSCEALSSGSRKTAGGKVSVLFRSENGGARGGGDRGHAGGGSEDCAETERSSDWWEEGRGPLRARAGVSLSVASLLRAS
jgi:hypothetical protein